MGTSARRAAPASRAGIFASLLACLAISPQSAAQEGLPAALQALGARLASNAAGQVISVDLSNSWLTDGDLALVAQLPALESLTLSYTKITDLGLEQLSPLRNVRRLDLYYAEAVTDLGIAHLKHWKQLEYLNLRGTKVTSTLFEHLAGMEQLRFLDIGHSRVNDDLFELLAELPRLEHFAFGGNKISGAALPLLKSYPALRSLSLSGQQRTDSGLWSVAVTDFAVAHLAAIERLETLDLGDANITDRGVAELARLKHLRTLDLHGTRVTSKGLAALVGLDGLRRLRLWKARGIEDAAAPVLLKMPQLEVLELAETNFTAAGLRQLASHPGLKQLYLGGLSLTPADVDALRQAMPACHISWWPKPAIEYPETVRRSGN